MPTEQKNFRLETAYDNLRDAARQSARYKDALKTAFESHLRLADTVNSVLTDSNNSDSDFITNGGRSPTIGEYKKGLRAIASFLVHAGEVSESKATTVMSDAGISDNTVLPSEDIDQYIDGMRLT